MSVPAASLRFWTSTMSRMLTWLWSPFLKFSMRSSSMAILSQSSSKWTERLLRLTSLRIKSNSWLYSHHRSKLKLKMVSRKRRSISKKSARTVFLKLLSTCFSLITCCQQSQLVRARPSFSTLSIVSDRFRNDSLLNSVSLAPVIESWVTSISTSPWKNNRSPSLKIWQTTLMLIWVVLVKVVSPQSRCPTMLEVTPQVTVKAVEALLLEEPLLVTLTTSSRTRWST